VPGSSSTSVVPTGQRVSEADPDCLHGVRAGRMSGLKNVTNAKGPGSC
jgi:hypothetical protein